jgi:hypothetical protein
MKRIEEAMARWLNAKAESLELRNNELIKDYEYIGSMEELRRIVAVIKEARNVYKPNTVSYDYMTGLIEKILGER